MQLFKMMYVEWEDGLGMCTVEPRYNEVLGITNEFLYPSHSKIYEKEPRYSEHILPVPWPFVKSMFHCSSIRAACTVCLEFVNERPLAQICLKTLGPIHTRGFAPGACSRLILHVSVHTRERFQVR